MLDFAALTAGSIEPITAGDVVRACDLADQYAVRAGARLAARDLLHAAVMLRAEGAEAKIVGCRLL